MTAVLVQLAAGLATEINDHDFTTSFEFEAVRSWADFDQKLEELESLKVDVVPFGHATAEPYDRSGGVHYVSVADIALRYKFKTVDTEESGGRISQVAIDDLAGLTEQVIGMLEATGHKRLVAYEPAIFKTLEPLTIAPRNWLRDNRQFLAILRVTYDIFT